MTLTKYHNKKIKGADGFVYDSKHEYRRYAELQLLQKAGKISNLQRQVRFSLVPDIREGKKLIERGVDYIADFTYTDENGKCVVEDAKGHKTQAYIIKRKLMLYTYGIKIREV